MKVDRTAFKSESIRVDVVFGKNCLGCVDCSGMCWHLQELSSLPGAVLEREEASERVQP